jgi:hypothetical protein
MRYLLRLRSVTVAAVRIPLGIAILFICLPVHAQVLGSEAWNNRAIQMQKEARDRDDRLVKERNELELKKRELDIREREAEAAIKKNRASADAERKSNEAARQYEMDQNQKRLEYLQSQLESHEKLVKVQEIYYRAGEGSTAGMMSLYEQQKSFEHQIELLEATNDYLQSK